MRIERATAADAAAWAGLRHALWPQGGLKAHIGEILDILANDSETLAVLAKGDDQLVLGFAEACLRHDYVNGCNTSPVVFLEGVYVAPQARAQSVARNLIASVEAWGRSLGCTELASDALLENAGSHAMHEALGFVETERVVYFLKAI